MSGIDFTKYGKKVTSICDFLYDTMDHTPSFDFLEPQQRLNIEKALKKYSNNPAKKLNDSDSKLFLEAREQIQQEVRESERMCKVIPISDVKEYLSFKRELGTYMIRRADLDDLLINKNLNNIIDCLYDSLGLGYNNSGFKASKNRMGIVEITFPKYFLKVPVAKGKEHYVTSGLGVQEVEGAHFLGIGLTRSKSSIAEFYKILDHKVAQEWSGIYISDFDVNIYVADRKSNSLVEIARYSADRVEDSSEHIYTKFEILSSNKDKDIRDKIIREEGLIFN